MMDPKGVVSLFEILHVKVVFAVQILMHPIVKAIFAAQYSQPGSHQGTPTVDLIDQVLQRNAYYED